MLIIHKIDNIQIKMYNESLFPPHFMAIEDDKVAIFNLNTLKIVDSDLTLKSEEKISSWAYNNRVSLVKLWHGK